MKLFNSCVGVLLLIQILQMLNLKIGNSFANETSQLFDNSFSVISFLLLFFAWKFLVSRFDFNLWFFASKAFPLDLVVVIYAFLD